MSTRPIKLTGNSVQEVKMKSLLYLKQYPHDVHGTFFHTPRFVGYVDGRERWEMDGEKFNEPTK